MRTGRRRLRPLAGLVVGAVVSGLAVVGIAAPASAATGDVTGASLDWGFKDSWRSYVARFGGTATASGGATTSPAYGWSSGAGTFDVTTGAADVALAGTVAWSVPAHGISISLSDPEIVLDGDGTGELRFDYVDSTGASGTGVFATLTGAVPVLADGVATFTQVAAAAGPATAAVFTGSYPEGSALDPVSFALPYEEAPVQQSTTTTLGVSPSGSVEQGTDVELSATVSPAADGTVQFTDGGSPLGAPVSVSAGVATTTTGALAVGDHSLGAEFTPADPALFASSSASAVALTVTAPPTPAVGTTTSVALAPAAPVALGTATTATATVTAETGTATGSVEFFDVAAGTTDRVSLGTAAVEAGVATWTGTLGAGGHTVVAAYRPTVGFAGSEGTTTTNYGVVDTAEAASCVPASGAATLEGVSARWDYSAYSTEWVKSATGDITVDGQTFVLSDGVATVGSDCAVISFDGTLRVLAYPSFGGFWIDLTDPTLVIAADGTGTWSADVTTFEDSTPVHRVVSTLSGVAFPAFATAGTQSIALAFDGTTARGTWSANYSDAWSNAFVLDVPSSIRPFHYRSGETAGNLRKPPSPIELSWPALPASPTTTTLAVGPAAPVVQGTPTTLTATVAAERGTVTGSVEFVVTADGSSVPVSLGSAEVVDGVATLATSTLAPGGHVFTAAFTPAGAFLASTSAPTANYGIVDTTTPAACTVDAGSPSVEGVAASWDWSAYSAEWTKTASGESVVVDGDTFTFSDGVATYDQDCAIVQFDGSIRVTAYPAFGGFWVDLANPTLVVGADGAGLWTADVTTFESATPKRLVVDTVSLGGRPDFSASGEATATLDYDGTTASGTWKAGHDSAWANDFVVNVPSSLRAFYYASGSGRDADKVPSPIQLAWTVVPTPSDAGSLVWGFKQSWRSYVTGIAQGTITPSNGATTTSGGLFEFVQTDDGDFDPATGVGSLAYQGTVSFVSQAHGFDIAIADPIVTLDGTGTGRLSLLISTSDTAGTGDMTRVETATLTIPAGQPSGEPLTWTDLAAAFTDQLPSSFAQYAGQTADPVTFSYGAVVPPVIVPTVTLSSGEVKQGDQLVVTGTGFGSGAQVSATVHSDPVQLEPQTADAQGAVRFTWTVPADFATGAHTVEVVSAAGTASAQFTVTTAAVAPAVPAVASPAQQQCVAQEVTGATMSWGVKESFRTYITGPIAKGTISTSGVADNGSSYGWSGGSGAYNPSDSLGRVSYSGSVHFTGHGGQLDMTLANPRIQVTGPSSAVLIADISSKQLSGGTVSVSGTIATLSLSGGSSSTTSTSVSYSGVPATLTEYGASAFGGFYSGGAALDPVSFTWPLGADVPCDTTTDGKLASTGVDGADAMGALAAALALLVLGAGAVVIRRRRVRA